MKIENCLLCDAKLVYETTSSSYQYDSSCPCNVGTKNFIYYHYDSQKDISKTIIDFGKYRIFIANNKVTLKTRFVTSLISEPPIVSFKTNYPINLKIIKQKLNLYLTFH